MPSRGAGAVDASRARPAARRANGRTRRRVGRGSRRVARRWRARRLPRRPRARQRGRVCRTPAPHQGGAGNTALRAPTTGCGARRRTPAGQRDPSPGEQLPVQPLRRRGSCRRRRRSARRRASPAPDALRLRSVRSRAVFGSALWACRCGHRGTPSLARLRSGWGCFHAIEHAAQAGSHASGRTPIPVPTDHPTATCVSCRWCCQSGSRARARPAP